MSMDRCRNYVLFSIVIISTFELLLHELNKKYDDCNNKFSM